MPFPSRLVLLWVAVAGTCAAESPLPPPLAHWPLDDAGPEVRDVAGGHHGVVHGAVSVAGHDGRALLFDRRKSDFVEIRHAPDLELSTFTVAAWLRLTRPPTFSGVVGTRQGGRHLFDLKVNTDKVHGDIGDDRRWIDTKINFYKDDVGSDGQGGDLDLDRWYLVTYVIDSDRHECRLFLDGDLKKTIAFQGEPVLMRPGATLRIGDTGAGEFMDGVIDEVRIWRQPLDADQVRALVRPPAGP